jgi:hypothetical protein
MKFNKKAIMVSFLTTLILALIIFIPACMGVSKFFRLSDQAKDNFGNFVTEIQSLAEDGKEDENRNDVLILDQATAAVYFEPNSEEIKVKVDAAGIGLFDYTMHFINPRKCAMGKSCLCLFRKPEYKIDDISITITDAGAICREISSELELDNCGIGVPNDVNSYTCSSGFIVERNLAGDSSWRTGAYYEANRRTFFVLTKEGASIKLTPQT